MRNDNIRNGSRHEGMRNEGMRSEGMRGDGERVAQTTAADLRAVAQDMLRMGRHWARAAQGWLERAGDETQRRARARSDRDLQSDYSGGGYDQVEPRRGEFGYESPHGAGYAAYGDGMGRPYGDATGDYPGGRDYGGRDYRGVGPRNYARSDERIREDLNERLTEAWDLDASGLNVEVADGVATLRGNVPQRWMKHRAEDLADGCIGVRDVQNHIVVGGTGGAGAGAGETSTGDTGSTASRSTAGRPGNPTAQAGQSGKETT